MDETTIETDVANPFKMLSAYLTTAAITRPPKAYQKKQKYQLVQIYMRDGWKM